MTSGIDSKYAKNSSEREKVAQKVEREAESMKKAEFMEDTLKKLQQKVQNDGVVTSMCQGNYDIDRENPALKSYNTTIKNYTTVIKQLTDMLPSEEEKPNDDGFESFGDG